MTTSHKFALGIAAINVLFVLGFAATLATTSTSQYLFGLPTPFRLLLMLPKLLLILNAGLLVSTLVRWLHGRGDGLERMGLSCIAVLGACLLILLNHWQLLI